MGLIPLGELAMVDETTFAYVKFFGCLYTLPCDLEFIVLRILFMLDGFESL